MVEQDTLFFMFNKGIIITENDPIVQDADNHIFR